MQRQMPESFIGVVRKGDNQGLLEITLPVNFCKYLGLEIGTNVKVWVKVVAQKENAKNNP